VGGKLFNLPEQVVVLLQKAFEAMSNSDSESKVLEEPGKGKAIATVEPMEENTQAMLIQDGAESSKQGAAPKEGSGKLLYCFCCKTKGHAVEECHARMFCDICEISNDVRLRCPKFRAAKGAAMPCGFSVEGLGVFHIPHESSIKQRTEARLALINVTNGVLSIQEVIAELQRLIPSSWVWNVEAVGNNGFRIVFPSRVELLRMVEWGEVHSKFQNDKLRIEERMVDNEVRYILPKVWVQFTGLPSHLQDYLIIWAVGAILGVTKNVDLVFTRRFDICHLQVLVLNKNSIPQAANVVIGDNLYELNFRVELNPCGDNPQPMEMDNPQEGGGDQRKILEIMGVITGG
jgi:hypothetical protein